MEKSKISFKNVEASQEYKNCELEMGDYKNLLEEGLKDMIFEVKEIDNHTDYIVKNNKIGYKIGDRY